MVSLRFVILLVIVSVVALSNAASLTRHARSPKGGRVDMEILKDKSGRRASLQYNQNFFKSKDGRGTLDAYAQGSRNFDTHRNDIAAGVRGSWSF